MTTEAPQAVTINGREYQLAELSDTVKNLLGVYNQWAADRDAAVAALNEAKLTLAKNEAALRDLSREVVELVDSEAATAPDA
jgi:hypothetical protein